MQAAVKVTTKTHGRPMELSSRRLLMLRQFPKRCGCCLAEHTLTGWVALPLLGEHKDAFARMEMRTCACGSTLAALTDVYDMGAE